MGIQPIRSEALAGVGYDRRRHVLTVKYAWGGIYEFYGIEPGLFEELVRSQPHPWSRVGDRVKAHPYRRL